MKNRINSMQIIKLALFVSYIPPLSILQLHPNKMYLGKKS